VGCDSDSMPDPRIRTSAHCVASSTRVLAQWRYAFAP